MRFSGWMSRAPLPGWLLVTATLVAALGLYIILRSLPGTDHRPDMNNLPIYEGAYDLTTRDNEMVSFDPDGSGRAVQTGSTVIGKITNYKVRAKPQDVLDFYKRAMQEGGWPAPTWLEDGKLFFFYVYRSGLIKKWSPIETFMLTVAVKDSGGVTEVELNTGL
jgi:hypothetical protein